MAAKYDIEQSELSREESALWLSIDKELLISDQEDDERLLEIFGVHSSITFVGYMNMKSPMNFKVESTETIA